MAPWEHAVVGNPTEAADRAGPEVGSPHARAALILAVVAMACLPLAVTGTNLAFGSIEAEFSGVSRSTLSWALSGYSIVIAAFTLLGGQLSDRFGSHRMFTAGLAVLGVASTAAAVAPTAFLFIAARSVQGIGGALIVPSSLAVALARWPEAKRTVAIGVWTAAVPIGSSVAPLIASVLLDVGSWRWIFAVPAGISTGALVVARWLDDGERSGPGRGPVSDARMAGSATRVDLGPPDLLGVFVGTVAIGLLALAIVEGPSWGWVSGSTLGCLAVSVALLTYFLYRSRRHPNPLVALEVFSIPTFRIASIANVLISAVGSSVWLVWPLMLTQLWHYDKLGIGIAMTPTPVIGGLLSIQVGRVVGRIGYRRILITGGILTLTANLWFLLTVSEHVNYWGRMFPGLVLYGVGMGLTFAPLNGAALADVPRRMFGQANAAFNTGRFLSSALGIAAAIAALGGHKGRRPVDQFHRGYGVLAVLAGAGAIFLMVFWPRRPESGP